MSELKFKVWDNVDYMSEPFTLKDLMLKKIEFTDECIVRQFTGLKDKNGKEIYKDDIVEYWEYESRAMGGSTDARRIKQPVTFEGGAFYPICNQPSTIFEIIGNIYEHKNLLEQK